MTKSNQKINKIDRKYGKILEINVLSTSLVELLTGLTSLISHSASLSANKAKFSIFTPNPEIILEAERNSLLKEALNTCDFPVPDGRGLLYASKFLNGTSINIIPGRKLCLELVKLSAKNGWKVFFLGGRGNEARIAAEKLAIKYPGLKIMSDNGPKLDNNAEPVTKIDIKIEKDVIDRINKFAPQILFVAFGNPKQEIWIYKHSLPLRGKHLNVRVMMAVGGTFRYFAGFAPTPPFWMEEKGLEWLWRLITEPTRIVRIFRAVVIFPLKVILFKLMNND